MPPRAMPSVSPRHAARRLGLLAGALLLAACGDKALRLPRSEAGLAEASRRGDSLAARIAAGVAIADSLERIARGELEPGLIMSLGGVSPADPPGDTGPDGTPVASAAGLAITARARARADSLADSLARAGAQRADSLARAVTAARLRVAGSGASTGAVPADTLRGTVTVEGVPPAVRVMLVGDGVRVALTGLAVRDLLNLDGLDVMVRGVPGGPRELVVSAFVARAYGGTPVLDGLLLRTASDGWALRLTDGGLRPLGAVPAGLQRYAGSRVWIAASATASFGVITER